VCDTPATTMDVYPTLLELARMSPRPGQLLDGVSLAPLLADPLAPVARGELYWHLPHYHHSTPASAIRRGDWKLIEFFEDEALELYNLRADLGEVSNLASREPGKVRELRAALATWRRAVGARMPVPNPEHDPARAGEMGRRPRAVK